MISMARPACTYSALKSATLSVLIMGMKEKESIYHFFGKLPDFVKEKRILLPGGEEASPPSPAAPPAPQGQPGDPDAFLEAMKDVKRIASDKTRVPQESKEGRCLIPQPHRGREMEEILRDDHALNVINLPEYMEGYVDDLSPLVLEKLRNNEFSVQKVLDLHGLSADDAQDAFRSFVRDAVQSQVCCVKVIHGRGLKSRRGPVLKEKLKEWIVQAMHRKWVVAFASSRMSAGGPGATIVLLRATARKRRLHIIG